jgi:hypothetical protein
MRWRALAWTGAAAAVLAGSARAAAPPTQVQIAAAPAVKLVVTTAGWQHVPQATLLGAGLDPQTDPRQLRLFADGVEQGISVTGNGDGVFDADEAVEFYGVARDTLWTGSRTYWLVTGGAGKPIPLVANPAGLPAPANFPALALSQKRTTYFAALLNGDASNFFGDQVTTAPVTEIVTATHVDTAAPATLQVVLQGVTAGNHQVAIALNGQAVGSCSFPGQALQTCLISPVTSVEGSNDVVLTAGGTAPDVSLVSDVELDYDHLFVADGDALALTPPPLTRIAIAGFSSPDARVMDVSDPDSPVELVTGATAAGSSYTVGFNTPGDTFSPTLYAFAPAAAVTPAVMASRPSSWTAPHAGELVILSNAQFVGALAPLVAARRAQGWTVQLVDLQDVYDEFGGGDKSVPAVRDFLQAIRATWAPAPRFVLLVGDATFDSRNFLGLGDFDFAPTKLIDTQQMETASDDWFVDWDGDGLPDIAIGRLSVRTAAEAATVVQKIVGYPGAALLAQGGLFVADADESGLSFEEDSLSSAAAVAGLMPTQNFFLDQATSTEANLLPLLDAGPFLVNYMGHGSVSVWDGLFSGTDAAALTNGALSIYVSMNCLNGFFHDVYTESLAETLTKAPNGGAVAAWASSTLTSFDQQGTLNQAFVKRLTRTSLGEAAMAAKREITDPDAQRTWILFGDPTLFGTPTSTDGGAPSDAGVLDAGPLDAGGQDSAVPPADAGRPRTADGGDGAAPRDAGADAGSLAPSGDAGCGCQISRRPAPGELALLGLLAALRRVRRPRRRPAGTQA